jgi:hypothetical protein
MIIPDLKSRDRSQPAALATHEELDLRRDVDGLLDWKKTSEKEKDRQQDEIEGLKKRYNWALGMSLLAFFCAVIDLGLLCYLSWH